MGRSANSGYLGTAGLGLVAAAIASGGIVTPVDAARVGCIVTSSTTTSIAARDGYASAVLDIAAYSCGEIPRNVSIDASIAEVASAMAEVVASVVGTCTGSGSASTASVSGLARASVQAEAVGTATAAIIATADVCGLCNTTLETITSVMETVSVRAFAEAEIQEDFEFEDGPPQTLTAEDISEVMREEIVTILAEVTGELLASPIDGCTGELLANASAGNNFAACEVVAVADDIRTEIDAIAELGIAVQALACAGGDFETVNRTVREVAVAVAQAVTQAQVTCEHTGGEGSIACGFSSASVDAVATATARAFASGLATVSGADCVCNLTSLVSTEDVQKFTPNNICKAVADGESVAFESDFQIEVEESLGEAIANVVLTALGSSTCEGSFAQPSVCAEAGVCIDSNEICSSPDGILSCCEATDVCAQMPGQDDFTCILRPMAESRSGTEMIECE